MPFFHSTKYFPENFENFFRPGLYGFVLTNFFAVRRVYML